jgi:hypothetical protein
MEAFQETFVESFQLSGNPEPVEIPLSPEPLKWVQEEVSSWASVCMGIIHIRASRKLKDLIRGI